MRELDAAIEKQVAGGRQARRCVAAIVPTLVKTCRTTRNAPDSDINPYAIQVAVETASKGTTYMQLAETLR